MTYRQINALRDRLMLTFGKSNPPNKELLKLEKELKKKNKEHKELQTQLSRKDITHTEWLSIKDKIRVLINQIVEIKERIEENKDDVCYLLSCFETTVESGDWFVYFSESCEYVLECCGIGGIKHLNNATSPKEQALMIASLMVNDQLSQVVITDTIKSKAWAATKSVALPGPVTRNFKTKNDVRHWTVTPDMIETIFNLK